MVPNPSGLPVRPAVEDLTALQQSLLHLCLVSRAPDGWVWSSCPFSIQNFYRQLRKNQLGAVLEATQSYRLIWRQKVPLKLSIFGWLLVQNRLVTRVTCQRISPASLADCSMCSTRLEDCSHLFFECPVAWAVWAAQSILLVVTLSEESFWDSLRRGAPKPVIECGRLFVFLWAIWLHCSEVVFQGRIESVEGIIHMVEALVSCWFRGT